MLHTEIVGTDGPCVRRSLRQAGTIRRFSMRKPEARVPTWVAGILTAMRFAKGKAHGDKSSCMVKKGTPAESFDSAGVRRVAVTYSPTFAVPSAL